LSGLRFCIVGPALLQSRWRILLFSLHIQPMPVTRSFRHQNYELLCGANPVDGAKFAPSLVISKQVWPWRPRVIDVPRGEHASETSAIEAARAQGVEWVLNYG
jgi:hypothetical protein